MRYSNPKVDEYLETARYSTSEEVRQEAMKCYGNHPRRSAKYSDYME